LIALTSEIEKAGTSPAFLFGRVQKETSGHLAARFPLSAAPRGLLKRSAHTLERRIEGRSQVLHCRDDGDRDASGNEAIFNGGHAVAAFQEFSDHVCCS
jgi:hypothetical protein